MPKKREAQFFKKYSNPAKRQTSMDRFTILRKNKEYGPYTLQELVASGLYASDLIWVEGQSSAWRSAMDIESLQSFIRFPEAAYSPGKEATVIKPVVTGMAEKKNP
jgi:hypothetical protein